MLLRRDKSARTPAPEAGSTSSDCASVHSVDSLSPCRSHHVTAATTNRCRKISRLSQQPERH